MTIQVYENMAQRTYAVESDEVPYKGEHVQFQGRFYLVVDVRMQGSKPYVALQLTLKKPARIAAKWAGGVVVPTIAKARRR